MLDTAKIISNQQIAPSVWKMELETSLASKAKPGQFVQVDVPGFFLKRPISICDVNGNQMTLIYKVIHEGTQKMSELQEDVEILGPLGNGFPIQDKDVTLIGGGVGTPPLVWTAKEYLKKGYKVSVVLGFNTRNEVFGVDLFRQMGIEPIICTMDGSQGIQGTVLEALCDWTFVQACGPLPMLKAIQNKAQDGHLSLEARMACGYGVCMGCVVKNHEDQLVRVCKEGPVFEMKKVVL